MNKQLAAVAVAGAVADAVAASYPALLKECWCNLTLKSTSTCATQLQLDGTTVAGRRGMARTAAWAWPGHPYHPQSVCKRKKMKELESVLLLGAGTQETKVRLRLRLRQPLPKSKQIRVHITALNMSQ